LARGEERLDNARVFPKQAEEQTRGDDGASSDSCGKVNEEENTRTTRRGVGRL